MSARGPTWVEVAIQRVGLRNAIRALSWALDWGVVRESLGHDPTAEEVAKWWIASERTTYREQAAFRSAFPELDSPAPLCVNREGLAVLADFGDKLDKSISDNKARRAKNKELTAMQLGLGIAKLG